MQPSTASDVGIVIHMNMTCEHCVVGEDAVIADDAIMSDMHIAHDKIVRSDPRDASTVSSTAMNRGMFANHVEVAHLEPSWFAVKLEILRIATN